MRHLIIDTVTKVVVNAIEWAGADYVPPANTFLLRDDERRGEIGDTYSFPTDSFIKPVEVV